MIADAFISVWTKISGIRLVCSIQWSYAFLDFPYTLTADAIFIQLLGCTWLCRSR